MPALASACDGLRDGPKGTVTQIVDGDTVLLDTGLVVRLMGIQAPKLGLGRPGIADWPLGETSKAALSALVLNRKVRLRYGGAETDRYDRALGQLYVAGDAETWVQREMLAQGMARVYSFPDNRACLPELFAAESRARAIKLGIWADPYYTVRRAERPETMRESAGRFELVEGRVLRAGRAQGGLFLNFGRLWKLDFTALIDARALRLFGEAGRDPTRLEGALVRIRGWLDIKDGPRIEVTHPEQIEVLALP